MTALGNPEALFGFRKRIREDLDSRQRCIQVCASTGCLALGGSEFVASIKEALQQAGLTEMFKVLPTGCRGFCEKGPHVTLQPEGITYSGVTKEDAVKIVQRTLVEGELLHELLYVDPVSGDSIAYEDQIPFYAKQLRRVLALNGEIDPTDISGYIASDGYEAVSHVLRDLSPDEVISVIQESGLRGRGGAGFPTGEKWRLCKEAQGDVKYVICNADEGDPGAFMDRSILEGNPHSVIEGMIIGAYAMGAASGYVYIRNEYPLAVKHLDLALRQARAHELLGENILGSGFDFDIEIRFGSGAFICGEETALIASIEGRIGEPRPRPPYPAQSGLWGMPTNNNNVKTWANVPLIFRNGPDWFAEVGSEKSKGTMIFSLVGNIRNTGLVEVPMGISLRELIYDIGGGIPDDKEFKAAQIGGPSGGCIPGEHLEVPVDYESLSELGAIMGSGGLVVCDEDTCMVDFARYFLKFTQEESCGKCIPCRVGTYALLQILQRICDGQGEEQDLNYLLELSEYVKTTSLCGLGQTAPNPVLTTIRYFRDEYEAHIFDKHCPAKVCKGLITYEIIPEACTGCMVCARNCPSKAISGEKKEVHVINTELCSRCGICRSLCNFDAVLVR
ncbi:MAG: NADH-quinone oxidoreductase subunit F [Anaerolineales bacterium]|nr:NADH-quinone oxidoreductase subunit F [Anaerolineales bacterium]